MEDLLRPREDVSSRRTGVPENLAGGMLQHLGGSVTFLLTALAVVLGGVCCRRAALAR